MSEETGGECVACGGPLPLGPWRSGAIYCSTRCSKKKALERLHERNPSLDMSTATIGAVAEMAVAVDLALRGYEVFRAISGSCSCDLIAARAGRLLRVEVRTGAITVSGKTGRCPTKASDGGKQDVFAVWTKNGQISYFSELETFK